MIDRKELTLRRLLAVWWAMTWRAYAFLGVGTVAIGFPLGAVLATASVRMRAASGPSWAPSWASSRASGGCAKP
jgi:hypothetical protein